jgi:hypothetical protein
MPALGKTCHASHHPAVQGANGPRAQSPTGPGDLGQEVKPKGRNKLVLEQIEETLRSRSLPNLRPRMATQTITHLAVNRGATTRRKDLMGGTTISLSSLAKRTRTEFGPKLSTIHIVINLWISGYAVVARWWCAVIPKTRLPLPTCGTATK